MGAAIRIKFRLHFVEPERILSSRSSYDLVPHHARDAWPFFFSHGSLGRQLGQD